MNDLEELKRLLAAATPLPWSLIPQTNGSELIAHIYETDSQMKPVSFRMIAFTMLRKDTLAENRANGSLIVAVNALPDLIARVERAEALLQKAIGRAEEIIERADTKAEDAGSDTEERAYYEGRMEAAIAISNTLTGDTPNV